MSLSRHILVFKLALSLAKKKEKNKKKGSCTQISGTPENYGGGSNYKGTKLLNKAIQNFLYVL